MELEKGFWESGSDPKYYERSMDEGAISVMEPMGFISKHDAVEMSKDGEDWTDLKMHDVKVVELTPDCVAIAYHGEAKGKKSGKPYRGSVSLVYVRREGAWKFGMTTHQPWKAESEKGAN